MPWIVHVTEPGTDVGVDGHLYWFRYQAATPTEITVPTTLGFLKAGGSGVNYKKRLYMASVNTDNSMVDEYLRSYRLGIATPTSIPTIAAGAGTGITGSVRGYVSFYDSLTDERSYLSGVSNTLAATDDNIVWTNLPTTSDDSRVTHIELWRDVDGGATRLVGRWDLGTSTVTENVATLALGETAPTAFQRFAPCSVVAMYHDRLALAGDECNRDTLYLSAQFKPERFEGLTYKTRNGEPIVALINVRDQLLVLCPDSSYIFQGYTEADATFNLSEPELGALGHRHVKLAHGNAIIPNARSIYLYNGSWHNIMPNGQEEWRRTYSNNREVFESGFGVFDPVRNVYKVGFYYNGILLSPDDLFADGGIFSGTYYWVADLTPVLPELAGGMAPANWSFDLRTREDTCAAVLFTPDVTGPQTYTGSADGYVRKENVVSNTNDDSDTYDKRLTLRTGAISFNQPGGGLEEGKELTRAWTYVESDATAWDLYLMGGDEQAWKLQTLLASGGVGGGGTNVRFFFRDSVEASLENYSTNGRDYVATPKTVHEHTPYQVTGRCFTALITAAGVTAFYFRGYGGWWGPGPTSRPPISESSGA